MKRLLTGVRPSGDIHLGNYFAVVKPALELQDSYQCLYFLADQHTLTTIKDPTRLNKSILDTTAAWLACGLDPAKSLLYQQVGQYNVELSWYLSCVAGFGFVEKGHAYKDAMSKGSDVNVGVFSYPLLMAADILLYDADIVPLGKDQKQHLEMARDMAGAFNAIYGPIFKLPEIMLKEDVMTIPGLDGRKMSKSYDNVIPLFGEEKAIRKNIMAIATDSSSLEASKTLNDSILGQILPYFLSKSQIADIEARLNKGGIGWGHIKAEFADLILKDLEPIRKKYFEIRPDENAIRKVLKDGAEKALAIGQPKIELVRKAIGLRV